MFRSQFDLLFFISVAALVCPSEISGLPIELSTHNARDGGDAFDGIRSITINGAHDIPKRVGTFPIPADTSPNSRRYFDPDDPIVGQNIWRKDTDVRDVTRLTPRQIRPLESGAQDHIAITIHDPADLSVPNHDPTTSNFVVHNHGSLTMHNHAYVPGQHYTIHNHGSMEVHNHGAQFSVGSTSGSGGMDASQPVGQEDKGKVKKWVPKAAKHAMIKSVVGMGVKGAVGWGSSLADCAVTVARACVDHYANNGHGGHDKSD